MRIPTHDTKRKAISPVLATVILIAITLIAAVAIAGFVFGLFGTFTSTAQVSASVSNLTATIANTAKATPTCSTTQPASNFIQLINTGTSSATVQAFSINFGGNIYSQAPAAGCTVAAGGVEYITITGLGATGAGAAVAGEQFIGSVSMSNGGAVALSGSFK